MCPVSHLELAKDTGDVVADRFRTDDQALGNLMVVEALRNEFEHFTLAGCQFRKGLGW
jgi:hypothetical protein